MATKEPAPLTTLVLVQAGYISRDKQVGYGYRVVDTSDLDNPKLKDEVNFYSKAFLNVRPGIMVTVEITDEDGKQMVKPSTARYAGAWPDRELATRWQVSFDAFMQEVKMDRELKRKTHEHLPYERLEPFRRAYAQATRVQRDAIMLLVMRAIRGE